MAYHFLTFVTLLSFALICNGQIFEITNTETSVSSCQSIDLTWEGGTPPFSLSILDSEPLINVANATDISARRQTGDVLVSFPSTNARTQTWIVDLPPDITRVSTQLVDSQGLSALPKLFTVNTINGAQCSSSSSSSTTSLASSSTSSTASTTSASSQSSASTTSSSSSSSSSASNNSAIVPPTSDVATLPTQTPSSSAPASTPTTDPDKAPKQTNALAVPVPAIIGISVGGAIALVVLMVGIYCFRKQTRTRSDPLEGWNGGYDPESVLKATSRYDGSGKFGSGV